MILEIIEGPEIGRRVKLREGSTVSFGRTGSAMEQFTGDQEMSALHFAVSLSGGTLRMQNHSQTNGSEVNGARVATAVLASGDKLRAGGTVFAIIGPPPSPFPAQVRIGGWGFNIIPQGWKPVDGIGLIFQADSQQAGSQFRASVAALEESLPEAKTLGDYVDVQIEVAKSQLKAAEIQGPAEARMQGADEALLLTVSSDAKDGMRITQRQIYARNGDVVGILTMSGLAAVNQDFIEIVRGANFHKPQIPA
jgi:hypothetical protein